MASSAAADTSAVPSDPSTASTPISKDVWQIKRESCAKLRAFEAQRSAQIDKFQARDRAYWRQFQEEIRHGGDENARLLRFFTLRLQADLTYADALRQTRAVLDAPMTQGTTDTNGLTHSEQLNVQSSVSKALYAVGEVQQQLAEKLVQLTTVVKREVTSKPLEEMTATFKEKVATMLAEGEKLDAMLFQSQKNVLTSFAKFDELCNQMESEKENVTGLERVDSTARRQDLWLAEMNYCINVQKLQYCRVEYVTGMSALFQQYKTMEVWRASVIQTALDTYIRKQKLTYSEMAGAMTEPLVVTQFTAAALSASEDTDAKLFSTLRSPIVSPLLVRCGFLKNQVSGSLFTSWKEILCAITQDGCLHLLDLKVNTNRSILESTEAMLMAIATNEQNTDVISQSVYLTNCRIEILGKSTTPSFEITEVSPPSGLLSSMLRVGVSRKLTFQCPDQSDLIDWVVAAKRFISAGSSMAFLHDGHVHHISLRNLLAVETFVNQEAMGLLDGLITGFARKSKFGRSHSLRPLTSKRANRRFYKGNGCRNEGTHAKRGRYVVDQDKLLQLEVPDLTGFKLKAYVSPLTPNRRPQ
ncbi:hypothetical protein DD238_003269 [Peronospora effusa]|uniref:PH domain-containing protein n=1 Tax=Peronospora effusa TaxID=542832 RepID=A0A3M6VG81_9STRA|nr:hypothetical protein DD238_003269 [Peronospora effusa]